MPTPAHCRVLFQVLSRIRPAIIPTIARRRVELDGLVGGESPAECKGAVGAAVAPDSFVGAHPAYEVRLVEVTVWVCAFPLFGEEEEGVSSYSLMGWWDFRGKGAGWGCGLTARIIKSVAGPV